MFFDPHDFEVTTNLKRALSFVMERTSSLLPLFLKQRLKKKMCFSAPRLLFVPNAIEIWDAILAGDRRQLLRTWYHTTQSLSGDTSSSFSVGFFSKHHNEIIAFPSKMES